MATFEITTPDGRTFQIEGENREGALNALRQHIGQQPVEAEPERGFGQMLYENIIGSGEVDTPGERLGELVRGGTAAVARGIADVPALPANLFQLATAGVERATGMNDSAVGRALESLPDTREMFASVPVVGPESEYVAPGTAGEYISTIGEFAGGAGASAGPRAMLRYGAVPGAASEAAGQATEGTALEPYARAGAGIAASLAATPKPTAAGRSVRRADPERAEAAETLMRQGVRPTAGQTLDAESLMRAEGTLGPTAKQLDEFTKAALRTAGNTTAKRATPGVLKSTQSNITQGMNKILDVDVPITSRAGQKALEVTGDFFETTAGKNLPVNLRKVSDQLQDFATAPGPINSVVPATTLRKWRSKLGAYTTSSDEATREAAHALREVIDDMTEETLTALGRADDVAKLGNLRTQYRNFLTIADASTRGGREGASGLLTPERLSSAAKRVMGRTNYATGRATDLADLSRRGEMIIGAAPTVKPGGLRDVATGAGLTSAGGLAGFMGGGPMGALAGAAAGAAAPSVGGAVMRSGPLQSLIMRPEQFGGSMATLPGLLSIEPNR